MTISAATAGNNKNANKSLDFPIEVFSPPRPSDNYSFLCVCVCVSVCEWLALLLLVLLPFVARVGVAGVVWHVV